jgi:peptidoglycan-associated lipoprotein
MRAMKGLLLALSLVAVAAACGGKTKKQSTAGGDTGAAAESTAGQDTGGPAKKPAKDPSLQDVVYFAFDSSDLDEAARAKLAENAEWLKQDPSRTMTIEGHTDEVGTPEYNLGLGERRARATKDYLVRLGIPEERPAGSEDAKNRRSMFIATKKK